MVHLSLHYELAHALWGEVFLIFGIQWVMPEKVASLLFGWRHWWWRRSSDIWNLILVCLMWIVWGQHNSHTFEDVMTP